MSEKIDPVCGMSVDLRGARYKTVYKGKVYYFCSKRCLEAFERSPEFYLERGPQGMPE
ncbi:MAG: YHS domain-containing protein [Candidatus Verstraetearchaeota archaeon]|jgi:YHS domain-containing protein|nr:YHS domain-containing protein [Candidatus Verstraetearchaeota archaeon]